MRDRCRACGKYIPDDDSHFLSCNSKLSVPMQLRHNTVISALGNLIDIAGGIHRNEPTHIEFGKSKTNFYRTDIEALLHNNHTLLDVSITNPTSSSAIKLGSHKTQLTTAQNAAMIKIKKHRENATSIQAKFIPFIMESYGGIVPQCKPFLSSLHYFAIDNVSPTSVSHLTSIMYTSLAIAVQRGNSLMFKKCISMTCHPSVHHPAHSLSPPSPSPSSLVSLVH